MFKPLNVRAGDSDVLRASAKRPPASRRLLDLPSRFRETAAGLRPQASPSTVQGPSEEPSGVVRVKRLKVAGGTFLSRSLPRKWLSWFRSLG